MIQRQKPKRGVRPSTMRRQQHELRRVSPYPPLVPPSLSTAASPWRYRCDAALAKGFGVVGGYIAADAVICEAIPVTGHTKAEHRMGRNYLKGRDGDRINAVLAAADYNFGLLLRWLGGLLRALLQALFTTLSDPQPA